MASKQVVDKAFASKVAELSNHPFFKSEEAAKEKVDEDFAKLSTAVKYRVQCLRRMQLEEITARAELEEQQLILQQRYHQRLARAHEKRSHIINGTCHPAPEEQLKRVIPEDADYQPKSSAIQGIPEFWYRVLINAEMSGGWVDEEEDKGALCKLTDIKIVFGDPEKQAEEMPPAGTEDAGDRSDELEQGYTQFSIDFHFDKNDWFTNSVLRKTYFLSTSPDETESPLDYDGVRITASKGTPIQWKKDKCLTSKIVTKKQRNPKTGATRTVKRKEVLDSFFNFFENLPVVEDKDKDSEEKLEEKEEAISLDHELGLYFRDRIVPNAVLMFTNEFVDDEVESDDSDDSDDESEDLSDSDSEDDEPIENAEKPDCKQQ